MGNIGTPEIILIFLVILVLFGAKKIPELAQGLGKGIREFRKASREIQGEIEQEIGTAAPATASCYFCRASIPKEAKFCPVCGKSLEAPRCGTCGSMNTMGSKFCKECGGALPA